MRGSTEGADGSMNDAEFERFIARLPKAELHVHLEGAMLPATLFRLAKRRGVDLPAGDEAGLREWFRFRDFEHFVQIYLTTSRCVVTPEDFQEVARDFVAEQERQNVVYSEVHFTVATHVANGRNGVEVMDALCEVVAESEKRGSRLRFILDIVRNFPERADTTLDLALRFRDRGVVALGLTGMEADFANDPFRDHFQEADRLGLHRCAHAGEHAGPPAIRSALEVVRAERIGHGVRAVEDPDLVEELAQRKIPLEVCPSSNVCLGVFPSLEKHSFDALYRAGVEVSVNSDDPPMFDTSLTHEYERLRHTFGYTREDLIALARAPIRHAFLTAAERPVIERDFENRLALV
jgi:aminodeoxyfutalosine deaminase